MSNGLLWWDSGTFKRVDTIKTCVAVFISSCKISGLLRSLSVSTLICCTSLIKQSANNKLIYSIIQLNEKGQVAFVKVKFGQALIISKSSNLRSQKESEGWLRVLDRFKSYKSKSPSSFNTPSWLIESWLQASLHEVILINRGRISITSINLTVHWNWGFQLCCLMFVNFFHNSVLSPIFSQVLVSPSPFGVAVSVPAA